jgi:hypothetical protein
MDDEVLDYRSPPGPRVAFSSPRWGRRYLLFAPVAGLFHLSLYGVTMLAALQYIDMGPHATPAVLVGVGEVLQFPLITLFTPVEFGALALLAVGNAVLWGTTIVALWHAGWAIRGGYDTHPVARRA